MKPLFALLAIIALGFSVARADPASDLTAAKKEFPEYPIITSGFKYNPADPLVKDCREKYTKGVAAISPTTIKEGVAYLRSQLTADLAKHEAIMKDSTKGSAGTGQQYQNARANAYWLKNKVAPYLEKLAALAPAK